MSPVYVHLTWHPMSNSVALFYELVYVCVFCVTLFPAARTTSPMETNTILRDLT